MIILTLISLYSQDIPNKYKNITEYWKDEDYIHVYCGQKNWVLQLKKRKHNKNRISIYGGWKDFSSVLELNVGDICLFKTVCYDNNVFIVKVEKPQQ